MGKNTQTVGSNTTEVWAGRGHLLMPTDFGSLGLGVLICKVVKMGPL